MQSPMLALTDVLNHFKKTVFTQIVIHCRWVYLKTGLTALFVLNSSILFANDRGGWFEVTRGMESPALQSATVSMTTAERSGIRQLPGDRLWRTEPGDSFAEIAMATTGSTQHAFTIARYNQMRAGDALPASTVIAIPQGLLLPDQSNHKVSEPVQSVRWELQEFTQPDSNGAPGTVVVPELSGDTQALVDRQALRNKLASSSVQTINVDMFAGEVKVMGKVDVSRVAIGNGDIVRAEVLKSGELLIIGQTEGSTSLRLWHSDDTQSDFNIRVSAKDPETRVRMENMVRMRVRMIEFRKSALGKLGIDWSDSAQGPGFAIAGDALGNNYFRPAGEAFADGLPNAVKPFSTYFGIASNITSRINFLASTGDATTLAEPVLSTTSGGSASFLAGGEVPYPTVGSNGQTTVQFKEYGIKLNVSPSIDSSGNVRTIVETEISQLDPAVSIQGAPGLLTRRAQTQVNVRSGETIVISGLLSTESSKDIDKLPGIGNLPIIGSFFRTQNARNSVSELVIFVTPEIVEPADSLVSARQQEFFDSSELKINQARRQIQLLD